MPAGWDEGIDMKIAVPLLASLILLFAPCAAAQVTCAEIKTVMTAAEDDFSAFEGEKISEDYYKSTYALPGAENCTLDYGFDSIFSCLYVHDTLASAQAALNAHAASVAACLPGWSPDPLKPDAEATDGLRALQGTYYAGKDAQEDLEWAVFMEEHTVDGGQDWHVWVGLAYLL
jgi:hypothetical protein